jgi:hypothetical protein
VSDSSFGSVTPGNQSGMLPMKPQKMSAILMNNIHLWIYLLSEIRWTFPNPFLLVSDMIPKKFLITQSVAGILVD